MGKSIIALRKTLVLIIVLIVIAFLVYNYRGQVSYVGNNVYEQVAAGPFNSAALTEDGKVVVWGSNIYGQLGFRASKNNRFVWLRKSDGNFIRDIGYSPRYVKGVKSVKQIEVGYHYMMALLDNGKVMAWGFNELGQLGYGGEISRCNPDYVSGLKEIVQIDTMSHYNLALAKEGTVFEWGRRGSEKISTPRKIEGLNSVIEIAAGDSFGLALLSDGTVRSWGNNMFGQLGIGSEQLETDWPIEIKKFTNIKGIAAGITSSVAVSEDGRVYTWGNGKDGQLGTGDEVDRLYSPTAVELDRINSVYSGWFQAIATTNDGSAKTWGQTLLEQGEYISKKNVSSPIEVESLGEVIDVAIGASHALALLKDGTIVGWGLAPYGELGVGIDYSIKPIRIIP